MVSEAGASVYSASEVAREEFPELDVTVRGAISIARRLQDPLAELVKIDPRSIGVGQYQHDVSPHALKKRLGAVDRLVREPGRRQPEHGVHAPAEPRLGDRARAGARHRRAPRRSGGLFRSRAELLEVPRFSPRVFEQAAGFLRIPEARAPARQHRRAPRALRRARARSPRASACRCRGLLGPGVERVKAAADLESEVGAFTFDDIVAELEKPGRDPRAGFVPFAFRDDVHALDDLEPGMVCPGIVTNVTNFGAFVDIGVHQDGLVHISQLADRFVKDPREVVSPGDRVTVRVLEVKLDKNQIALTMKSEREPGALPAIAARDLNGRSARRAARRRRRRSRRRPPRLRSTTPSRRSRSCAADDRPIAPAAGVTAMSRDISAATLAHLQETGSALALIDVREHGEYNLAHIPGASSVPRRQLEARMARLVPFRGVQVVVCDDNGLRAALAAGRSSAWATRGWPCSRAASTAGRAGIFPPSGA